jgi:hypothetical protein
VLITIISRQFFIYTSLTMLYFSPDIQSMLKEAIFQFLEMSTVLEQYSWRY